MDLPWVVTIVVTVVLALPTIFLTLRVVRKKKPSWSFRTRHIIGKDADTPPELKILFGEVDVRDVYHTVIIFFNRGSDLIRGSQPPTDVKENVAVHLKGADILKGPTVLTASKDSIEPAFPISNWGLEGVSVLE